MYLISSPRQIQLYNVVDDPSETVELSGKYPDIVDQMLERLQYHQDRVSCVSLQLP